MIGEKRIQRFDFVNDPVTMLPPYVLGLDQYARLGTRIYYDDIRTVGIDVPERLPGVGEPLWTNLVGATLVGGLPVGGASILQDFCFHYPQWYLNAAWSAVPRENRSQLPVPLPVPRAGGPNPSVYNGCINPITVARGQRSEAGRLADAAKELSEHADEIVDAAADVVYNTGQLFANLVSNPVDDGMYYLRLYKGGKVLDIKNCRGENGCGVQTAAVGADDADNRFFIKKEFGAYTLRNGRAGNLDFLEVDADGLLENYGSIQMWEANLPFGQHSANQLWHFYEIPNRPGLFLVKNVASQKVLTGKAACVNDATCKVFQKDAHNNSPFQVWKLERAH
jgi:hypothetical protein